MPSQLDEYDLWPEADDDEEDEEISILDLRARVLASGFAEHDLTETILKVCSLAARGFHCMLTLFDSTRTLVF